MPFLAKSKEVYVLTASEGRNGEDESRKAAEKLAARLGWHGVAARAEAISPGARHVPQAVTDRALALSCDLLVMGAYSHSRMRELVFGGFTQHVLKSAALPVLLMH